MTNGKVIGIDSNLLTVEADGAISQNEICYVETREGRLMGEVIRVTEDLVFAQPLAQEL